MKPTFLLAFIILFSFGGFAQENDSTQYVVPNTVPADLSIYQAPEGFIPGSGFNGYYHKLTQTSIVMTMIDNINYVNLKASMTDEFFSSNSLVKTNEFTIDCASGLKGYGYQASFELNGMSMVRQMVFIGDLNKTLWLNITYPAQAANLVENELMESYKSVSFAK